MSRMWHWPALQLVTAQVQWPLAIMCSMRYSCLLPVTVWVTVVHCCHSMSGCCPLPVTVWLAFAHFLSQYEGHLTTSCHSMNGSCPLLVTIWGAFAYFLSQYEWQLPTSCHSMRGICPLPVTVWVIVAHFLSQYEEHLPTCYHSMSGICPLAITVQYIRQVVSVEIFFILTEYQRHLQISIMSFNVSGRKEDVSLRLKAQWVYLLNTCT